jgi:tetratricopeptide (TPR) repeat protein
MIVVLSAMLLAATADSALTSARDAQDLDALRQLADQFAGHAGARPSDHGAQYKAALAYSYLSEVALELKDKAAAADAAQSGIAVARRAVEGNEHSAEYHRILGTLCGQVIPANLLAGMKHGRCAIAEIDKAIELDGRSALAYVSRGVGNYYLPPTFGGGIDKAIADFRKAAALDPKSPEAHLWLGIALRKAGNNREAHAQLAKAVQLAPNRKWAKEQLAKTPAQ